MKRLTAAGGIAVVVLVVIIVRLASGGAEPSTTASATGHSPTTTIRVVVKDGKIEGGLSHEQVQQGSRVVIRVEADVTDEVHLHGYDIARDVAPGKPAVVDFVASLPGRFEVELESQGRQILELSVVP